MKKDNQRSNLWSVLCAGLLGSIVAMVTGTAMAQGAGSNNQLEEIVVTGSIIKRSEISTAMPITILSSKELALQGINTIADAVTGIPSNNAGTMNASWSSFGFATGASAVSLRGLTTADSLTVFDGMRMAPYPLGDDGRRTFVDLGTIPDSIVDRVEVLKDGASSTYGADAIAGVVNVITKKEITGLHINSSYGISQKGDGNEARVDVTGGFGHLASDGYNFYANVEIQRNDPIMAGARSKFGSWDWTHICKSPGVCLNNNDPNGLQADGTIYGVTYSEQPAVRPVDASGNALGIWRLDNPSRTCTATSWLKKVYPTNSASVQLGGPICEDQYFGSMVSVQPRIKRSGLNLHYTKELGDRAEAHAMFDYYRVDTSADGGTPYVFGGSTTPGGPGVVQVSFSPVILPVYVCPLGSSIGRGATCNASTTGAKLNPNNPFAAAGQQAQVLYRMPYPRQVNIDTQTFRYTGGIDGSFDFAGSPWNYTADVAFSQIKMDQTFIGYPIPSHVLNVIYDGSFNFVHPELNSKAMYDYIAPPNKNHDSSEVGQIQGTLSRNLFDMPGGPVVGAVGAAWRYESVNAADPNPAQADPYDRYLSMNTVSASGSRNVSSAFFEIEAPVLKQVTLNISGRYDKYSTGQSNFSPKVNLQFQPIDAVKLRGTYSQGFRIPSFNEAFGAPTTGYISYSVPTNTAGAKAFLAAHNNDAYVSGTQSVGLTAVGNPALHPEESSAYTVGAVFKPGELFEPLQGLSATVDYWHIKVDKLISDADYSGVIPAYYANNGVVNIPGITVVPDPVPDPQYPNALHRIGYIQYSYQNANSQIASGIDVIATYFRQLDFGQYGEVNFRSHLDLSYLMELSKTIGGVKMNFAGTLSPCNVTSCSGSPDVRWTWVNSFDWRAFTVALTTNFTSSYSDASVDFGGDPKNCAGSIGASVYAYSDGSPYKCTHPAWVDFDLSATYRYNDKLQLYLNVMNLTDSSPTFDPAPAYALYGFNPAWELNGWMGRFFRVGMKIDF